MHELFNNNKTLFKWSLCWQEIWIAHDLFLRPCITFQHHQWPNADVLQHGSKGTWILNLNCLGLNLGTTDWLYNFGQVPQSLYTCFAFFKIITVPTLKVVGSLKCNWHIVKCSGSVDWCQLLLIRHHFRHMNYLPQSYFMIFYRFGVPLPINSLTPCSEELLFTILWYASRKKGQILLILTYKNWPVAIAVFWGLFCSTTLNLATCNF